MLECYACLHRYYRAVYPYALIPTLFRRTATRPITEKKHGGIPAAPWPRRNASSIATYPNRNVLAKELQYLGDPLRLANNTLQLLKQPGQDEKALEMVRMASKSMRCTVSWNHLIDFYMNQGQVKQAMAMYYDVSA